MAQEEKDGWSNVDVDGSDEEGKVEFEIEGQEEEEVVQQEEPAEKAPPPVNAEEEEEEETKPVETAQHKELEGIETNGAQKRIRQLIKQRKDRDEQIDQLRQEIEQLHTSVSSKNEELHDTLSSSFENTQGQLESRLNQAKLVYKQATEQGDTDALLAAQEEISTVNAEKIALRENKSAFDRNVQFYQKQQEQQEQQVQQSQQQPAASQYDPKAINWASKNPWFGSDQPMTMTALQIDATLKEEGFNPSDEEYYEEVDSRLQKLFPSKLGQVAPIKEELAPRLQDAPSNSAQVVAGASRTPKTSSSNKKVKLSQEDIRLAEKWGISLEQYAVEKLKVEQSDGDYTTVS